MVCVSCIFIPIFIWIWFEFFMPIIFSVKSMIFGKPTVEPVKASDEKNVPLDEKKYSSCPFAKNKPECEITEQSTDAKKDN